ncbi:MAG: hypothetical protein ABIV21_09300, partial [Pyrinomonadaceae bacterium]
MDISKNDEIWQVETGDQQYEVNFAQIAERIHQGSLLRIDRVRKANLRWIEAGKVSSLVEFFNAKDANDANPTVVTTTTPIRNDPVRPSVTSGSIPMLRANDACNLHPDLPGAYVCETCKNTFCKACPKSYGSTVKICPFCEAICRSLAEIINARSQPVRSDGAKAKGFGFADLGAAFAYPFKFKTSLIFGALMFMIFSVGQSALGFGGISMLGPAIFCFILANTLTFGVLANTVENFSQGKLGLDFMPSFEDFSIWDDVIHPFFLSIGVYISSFGPLAAVFLIVAFLVAAPAAHEMNRIESDAAHITTPELPYAANAAKQSEVVRELLQKTKQSQQVRAAAIDEGDPEPETTPALNAAQKEEAEFARLDQMIKDSRKAQLESVVGKAPETVAAERSTLVSQLLSYGLLLTVVGGVCLLWSVFYFPAACAVAGYTRSFAATLNPFVGLDTIKRLGSYYFKIL